MAVLSADNDGSTLASRYCHRQQMGTVPDDRHSVASSGDASPTLPSNIATPRRKAPWRCTIRLYPVKPLFQRRWARRHPAHSVEDGQSSPKVADSVPRWRTDPGQHAQIRCASRSRIARQGEEQRIGSADPRALGRWRRCNRHGRQVGVVGAMNGCAPELLSPPIPFHANCVRAQEPGSRPHRLPSDRTLHR